MKHCSGRIAPDKSRALDVVLPSTKDSLLGSFSFEIVDFSKP